MTTLLYLQNSLNMQILFEMGVRRSKRTLETQFNLIELVELK